MVLMDETENPKQGKIMIYVSADWIAGKVVMAVLAAACFIVDLPYLGIAMSLITVQGFFHEFIHAAVVWYYKGEIYSIRLGKRPVTEFNHVNLHQAGTVYLAGALWGIACLWGSVAVLAIGTKLTGNAIYLLTGILFAVLFIYFGNNSDLVEWFKCRSTEGG